jgi:hypothetical protein
MMGTAGLLWEDLQQRNKVAAVVVVLNHKRGRLSQPMSDAGKRGVRGNILVDEWIDEGCVAGY